MVMIAWWFSGAKPPLTKIIQVCCRSPSWAVDELSSWLSWQCVSDQFQFLLVSHACLPHLGQFFLSQDLFYCICCRLSRILVLTQWTQCSTAFTWDCGSFNWSCIWLYISFVPACWVPHPAFLSPCMAHSKYYLFSLFSGNKVVLDSS